MDWIEAADILINHLKHFQLPNTQQGTFKLVDVFYRYKRYISTYLTSKTVEECNNIRNNLYSKLVKMKYSVVLTQKCSDVIQYMAVHTL